MATLDDKLLGEKTHYYCSSSSDEDDDDNDLNRYDREISVQSRIKWEGTSCNVIAFFLNNLLSNLNNLRLIST